MVELCQLQAQSLRETNMGIIVRKNGNGQRAESEWRADIKERIETALVRSESDARELQRLLSQQLEDYERRHSMSSETMLRSLHLGEMPETRDVSNWVWTWQTLRMIRGETPTTGIP